MRKVQKGRVEQVVSLLLIITFGIVLGVSSVMAQEIEDITPDQGFDIITLLQGQRATVGVTQSAVFGVHTVFVTSIGNKTFSASLSGLSPDALGWWTISALGTGGKNFSDIKIGLVPWTGLSAAIDISPNGSFAFVFSTVFITNKTAAELAADPISYNIAVGP